jgi:hypothetical protein
MKKQETTGEEGSQMFELYNGKVKGKFLGPTADKPNRHSYWIDGKQKTGVTTALNIKDKSTALLSWSKEQIAGALLALSETGETRGIEKLIDCVFEPERTLKKAGDLGGEVHNWIEGYIKHKLGKGAMPQMPEDPNVLTGVTSFLQWESEHKVKFMWSEKILYSRKHDFIGRGDFAAKVDGEVCLCDIKTGNGLYNSVRAQTAAYVAADTEESGTKYEGRWAIRISKETPEEYVERFAQKNRIRKLLGKDAQTVEPYQVFEAKYLDNEKSFMKRDFLGFMLHWDLLKWDKETDFYKEKIHA